MSTSKTIAGTAIVSLLALAPTGAGQVFPGTSNVGLEPPPGFKASTEQNVFQKGEASFSISELLPGNFDASASYKQLITRQLVTSKVRAFPLPGAPHAYLVAGVQDMGGLAMRDWMLFADFASEEVMVSAQAPARDRSLGDAAVERALRTIVLRKLPDVTAQLAALPYTVGDLKGFRAGAVVDETLRLTEGFRAVDPLFIQPRVFVVLIAGPKPGITLEAFSKHLLAVSDATVKPLEAKLISNAGVDWVRSEALSTDSVLDKADYVVEMVRA